MAWLELHQTLPRHPKLARLAGRLSISRPQAAGHLMFLWLWAWDYAPDGDLSELEDGDIAVAAEWSGDATKFVEALRSAGWVDDDDSIHNWHKYAGKLIEFRRKDLERKKASRESGRNAKPVRQTSSGSPTEVQAQSDVTIPNQTKPNQTRPDQPTQPELPASPWAVKFGIELHENLRTPACLEAVNLWLKHKAERREPYKETGLRMAMSKWGCEFTPDEFPACVEHSIAQGWQGIYRPRPQHAGPGRPLNPLGTSTPDNSAF